MLKLNRWIVFGAMVGLSGCATMPHPVPGDDAARQAASVRTRWIGEMEPWRRDCPIPATSGWTVRPLFPLQGLSEDLQWAARKAKLGRFCVYEYNGADPRPTLPAEVAGKLRAAEPDKVALTTSAVPALDAVTRDPFHRRFLEQVDVPATLPPTRLPRVRLAFLDTEPTGDRIPRTRSPRRSDHGYTLINVAGHLASGQTRSLDRSSLPVQIASRLTMPLAKLDPVLGRELGRLASGGARGTFTDLTTALWDEITWRDRQPQRPRLVLNLSLGWDGEKLGGWPEKPGKVIPKMTPEVQAVYDVLEVAACQGILVIAAAGNERPGPTFTQQPLLPAGWESLERGKEGWKCRSQPLVYAVSGVDARKLPLVNTRARGEAPRVAYADHVVVPSLYEPDQPTATLTGSSVAAAVVSATAALVWQYHPEMTAAQVMELLDRSGEDLAREPDFAAPARDPREGVRRIALCPALLEAGVSGLSGCPPQSAPPRLQDELSRLLIPDWQFEMLPQPPERGVVRPANINDQAEIGPQPGENPCPNCAVTGPPDQSGLLIRTQDVEGLAFFASPSFSPDSTGNENGPQQEDRGYRLLIEIPAAWSGLLREATVEVFAVDRGTGDKRLLSHCPVFPLVAAGDAGQTVEVTRCFDQVEPGTDFQASLSFVLVPLDGGPSFSIESPLFVED